MTYKNPAGARAPAGFDFSFFSIQLLFRENPIRMVLLGAKTLGTGVAAMAKSLYDSLTK